MSIGRNHRNTVQGVVLSNKNDKTIVVLVATHKKHPKYGKRVQYRKKYYVHDELNEARVGDTVTIMGTRPLSATKRFRLVSIDKKAAMTIKEAEEILAVEEVGVVEEVAEVKEELPVEQPTIEEKPKAAKSKAKAKVEKEEAVEVKEEK